MLEDINGTKWSPEIESHIYITCCFSKIPMQFNMERKIFFFSFHLLDGGGAMDIQLGEGKEL